MEIKRLIENSNIQIILDRIKSNQKIVGIFAQDPGLHLIKWCDKMVELVRMNIENKPLLHNIKYYGDLVLLHTG